MLPKAAFPSKSRPQQKTYPHSNFKGKNHVGAKRGGRFKKCFYQSIVSTQITTRVLFIFQTEFCFAEWRNSSWRWGDLQTSSEFLFRPSRHVNLECPAHQSAPDIDLAGYLQAVCRDHANPLQFLVGEVSLFLVAGALYMA